MEGVEVERCGGDGEPWGDEGLWGGASAKVTAGRVAARGMLMLTEMKAGVSKSLRADPGRSSATLGVSMEMGWGREWVGKGDGAFNKKH